MTGATKNLNPLHRQPGLSLLLSQQLSRLRYWHGADWLDPEFQFLDLSLTCVALAKAPEGWGLIEGNGAKGNRDPQRLFRFWQWISALDGSGNRQGAIARLTRQIAERRFFAICLSTRTATMARVADLLRQILTHHPVLHQQVERRCLASDFELAVAELVTNAILHGNLKMPESQAMSPLDAAISRLEMALAAKDSQSANDSTIMVAVRVAAPLNCAGFAANSSDAADSTDSPDSPDSTNAVLELFVGDEGQGFDMATWQAVTNPQSSTGRGIYLIKSMGFQLDYQQQQKTARLWVR